MSAPQPHSPPARREIFGWAMFDFANSSYTTLIVTVAFSVFFTRMVAPPGKGAFLWGLGIFLSNGIVVVLSPLVGAVADDSGRKKLFLFGTYLLCVLATAALYFVLPGRVALAMVLFIVSNIAFSFGENFTASFLPEISTPANIGKISGLGWGLGYVGGLACLFACLPLLKGEFVPANLPALRWVWVVTAAFFLVAAIPTFLFLRERAPRGPRRSLGEYARVGFSRLASTGHSLRHFSELARFLGVFFIFACGLSAVISFSSIFASDTLKFSATQLVWLFIALQVSSTVGALGFGFIQDRLGATATIRMTLALWVGVCLAIYFTSTQQMFYVVGLVAGLGIGSLQSASRALVGLFSPPGKNGEFFGFWGLAGKSAFAVGPFLFGILASTIGSVRSAILLTAAFFLIGFVGMFKIDEKRGLAAAEAWAAGEGREIA
jgi:UMF1 family MFS transporter